MKRFIFLLLVLFFSCKSEIKQTSSSVDKTLDSVLSMSSKNLQMSDTIQKVADQQTTNKINKTVQTIQKLEVENKQLKKELNEVTKKLDAVTNPDNGVQFKLLPISDNKENR